VTEALCYHSPRSDVPPPPGGEPITGFKLLFPEDWDAFEATHSAYAREWNKLTGCDEERYKTHFIGS
jgi:hypothetical protein